MNNTPKPSILVIDDETDLANLFSLALQKLPYRILTATSGEKALSILQDETPVLILLDVAMPPPNGFDLLYQIRSDDRFKATKIMILTAVPTRVGEAERQLTDRVIVKPIAPRLLAQTVIEVIEH